MFIKGKKNPKPKVIEDLHKEKHLCMQSTLSTNFRNKILENFTKKRYFSECIPFSPKVLSRDLLTMDVPPAALCGFSNTPLNDMTNTF